MSKYVENLTTKWDEILGEGEAIANRKVKRATAVMLENQMNYLTGKSPSMNESSSVDGSIAPDAGNDLYSGSGNYNTNAEFHKIAIPMVRRTFPELIAHDIVGVQPMTGPVGLAFALRFRADQEYAGQANSEIGYNTIDPYYTGDNQASRAMGTVAGEELGSTAGDATSVDGHNLQESAAGGIGDRGLGIGSGKQIKELSMTVEKAQVEAGTRKLRSRWSLEVAQDLKAMHGLDLEEEMMDVLAYEITAEIDRELINVMRSVASNNASSTVWDYATADGRGSQVDSVGGNPSGFAELDDLYYFQRKMYKSLKYPMSRVSSLQDRTEGDILFGSGQMGEITRDEIKWAKFLERQQTRFCWELLDMFLIHLDLKGLKKQYDLDEDKLRLTMTSPNQYRDHMKQGLLETSFNNYNSLSSNEEFSKYYLQKRFLKWTDDEIESNAAGFKKDKELMPDDDGKGFGF